MKNRLTGSCLACLLAIMCAAPSAAQEADAPDAPDTVVMPLRQWMAIGPLGGANLHERPEPVHPAWPSHNFVYQMYDGASYPMDQVIDLDTRYTGDITRHIDGQPRELIWQTVESDDPQGIVRFPSGEALPQNVGLTYASTWIRADRDMQLTLLNRAYDGEGSWRRLGATAQAWVNGEPVSHYRAHPDNPWIHHPHDRSTIQLNEGWNHVYTRVASTFAGVEIGYALQVDKDAAWDIEISAQPPDRVGRVFSPAGEPIRE